jgi:hypothetical protein
MNFKDVYSKAYDAYYYEEPDEMIDVGSSVGKVSSKTIAPESIAPGAYAGARGFIDAELGLLGELEGLYNGVKDVSANLLSHFSKNPEDKKLFDSFLEGLTKETVLPRFEDVREFLDEYLPKVPEEQISSDTAGQLASPGLAIKLLMDALKAAKAAKATRGGELIMAPVVGVTAEKMKAENND